MRGGLLAFAYSTAVVGIGSLAYLFNGKCLAELVASMYELSTGYIKLCSCF